MSDPFQRAVERMHRAARKELERSSAPQEAWVVLAGFIAAIYANSSNDTLESVLEHITEVAGNVNLVMVDSKPEPPEPARQ